MKKMLAAAGELWKDTTGLVKDLVLLIVLGGYMLMSFAVAVAFCLGALALVLFVIKTLWTMV